MKMKEIFNIEIDCPSGGTRPTVDELIREEDGSLHIRPDGENGVIYICTKPSWDARPEFIEVIQG